MSATASSAPGSNPQKPFQTKLVLLGEAAVGKSSVVLRFVSDDFQENKEPTIGAAFLTVRRPLQPPPPSEALAPTPLTERTRGGTFFSPWPCLWFALCQTSEGLPED